jgi:uroporphyrin-III C-methyltransferase
MQPDAPPPLVLPGRVTFVGAGPGDVDHLTLRAARALTEAEVVIHDRLVGPGVLALAGPEAVLLDVGKEGFGPSTPQAEIDALVIRHARAGRRVVRLKGGDCGVFGRLDEEIAALEAAGIGHVIVPGLTAATAAAAAIGRSLTQRGRNRSVRILTGRDVAGLAEHDWRGLARDGEVAAIYMARASARFLQGRLMMHGAAPDTAVTVVANLSLAGERVIATDLAHLPAAMAGVAGPAVLLYGLAPRRAAAAIPEPKEVRA